MGVKFVGIEPCAGFGNQKPSCPHGPMLLFERCDNGAAKAGRQFYACAACRDRKQCPFFLWRDEKISKEKVRQWQVRVAETKGSASDHQAKYDCAQAALSRGSAVYCATCGLVVSSDEIHGHRSHHTRAVSGRLSTAPSQLFQPMSANKSEAQYLFSASTVSSLQRVLLGAGVRRVVCCGAPRLHETLLQAGTDSLMLDMDRRYEEFWSPQQLVIFNMFNNHCFTDQGRDVLRVFLSRDGGRGLGVVIDPPFGGRLEALNLTLSTLLSEVFPSEPTSDVPVFLILPYFNESDVHRCLPRLHMTDLRIDYDNHASFTTGGRKHGSPVRLFTNVSDDGLELPEPDYRWCEPCRRRVHHTNVHCPSCKACTSKDGRPYRHCNRCSRCVKDTWRHCELCGRCALPDHPCTSRGGGATCKRDVATVGHRSKKRRRK